MGDVIQFPSKAPEDEPAFEVMVATMYSDGRIRTWLSDKVQSAEQYLWVHERLSTVTDTLSDLRKGGE